MRELREAKPKTGFAFRDSLLAPRNALLFLIPFVISSCEELRLAVLAAWQVGADQFLCLDNDHHVLRFSDRVDGTGVWRRPAGSSILSLARVRTRPNHSVMEYK
mgnify:FL=1